MKISPTFDRVDDLIEEELEEGTFPGGVLLIRETESVLKHEYYGLKSENPSPEAVEPGTIFDLASLTKVVVTTTLTLQLVESGVWSLTDPVSDYLDEFSNREVTLKDLLTHTSGLMPWTDLFSGTADREGALERLFTDRWPILEPILPPRDKVIYSDLNFILLGLAIERVKGESLDDLSREKIFRALGMEDTGFNPSATLMERIAPTEDSPTRGEIIRGQVHDENCHALGGVSGHAGLFGPAKDLGNFVASLLNRGSFKGKRILGSATVDLLGRNFTKGLGDRRTLGWQLQGKDADSAGNLLSPESFGHTGFTGGSIWIDPAHNLGTVFLTNRVHPDRNRGKDRIGDFRGRLHNTIIGEIHE
ncbi:MAG: serine hydrolase [Candidatus Bipolaricaulota bacterium]|nr:serine hydrolase [Candidatus Bipolaricaulota bacterium]